MSYRPNRHYWIIGGSTTEVYYSGTNSMVPVGDPGYVAWLAVSSPNQSPNLPAEAASIDALREVLAPIGLHPEWLIVTEPSFIQPAPGAYAPEQLREYSADVRWREEVTGINAAGHDLATDRKSQGLSATAAGYARQNSSATINYKVAMGTFVPLTSAQAIQASDAISAHVQTCFDTEKTVSDQIVAGTVTTLAQVDAAYEPLKTRKGRRQFSKLRHFRNARNPFE